MTKQIRERVIDSFLVQGVIVVWFTIFGTFAFHYNHLFWSILAVDAAIVVNFVLCLFVFALITRVSWLGRAIARLIWIVCTVLNRLVLPVWVRPPFFLEDVVVMGSAFLACTGAIVELSAVHLTLNAVSTVAPLFALAVVISVDVVLEVTRSRRCLFENRERMANRTTAS